ncbi:MAG: tetraacyldisaccharide 4'-kinase [Bacteroidales bacterium]|nr:tetraacyldisaccharide 4'-kinase [Bacteroidales bacterium]
MWYAIVVAIRNLLFDMGLLQQTSPNITTIGVGNLACGGTGKTPHVEYLLRLLSDTHPTAMLSLGYKRKSSGYQEDDGEHSAEKLGDEAAMVAAKFPKVQVAVCKKRVLGIEQLMQHHPDLKLIVLDDVFQHRHLRPSLNILLTDYRHPFYKDHILPFGDLRESRRSHSRANIIIVTKTPEHLNPIERHNITAAIKAQTYQKVFFSYMEYGKLTSLFGNKTCQIERLDNVLCVTGIAHPEELHEYLKSKTNIATLQYNDHHNYREDDIAQIVQKFESLPEGNRAIITTEKDAARLRESPNADSLRNLPIYTIEMHVAFHNIGEHTFDQEIRSIVHENIIFQQRLRIYHQQ